MLSKGGFPVPQMPVAHFYDSFQWQGAEIAQNGVERNFIKFYFAAPMTGGILCNRVQQRGCENVRDCVIVTKPLKTQVYLMFTRVGCWFAQGHEIASMDS